MNFTRSLLLAITLTIVAVASLAAANSGLSLYKTRHASQAAQLSETPLQTQSPPEKLEVELLTLRAGGFEPAEIRRHPGPFIIAVENISGMDAGTLRLEPASGGPPSSALAEARMARGRFDWNQRLELPPGTYLLGQTGGAGHSCRIIISSH